MLVISELWNGGVVVFGSNLWNKQTRKFPFVRKSVHFIAISTYVECMIRPQSCANCEPTFVGDPRAAGNVLLWTEGTATLLADS